MQKSSVMWKYLLLIPLIFASSLRAGSTVSPDTIGSDNENSTASAQIDAQDKATSAPDAENDSSDTSDDQDTPRLEPAGAAVESDSPHANSDAVSQIVDAAVVAALLQEQLDSPIRFPAPQPPVAQATVCVTTISVVNNVENVLQDFCVYG